MCRAFAQQIASTSQNNAVAFLPNTLRAGTRTLFSFQGAVELFSRGEEKPEMYRLKPEAPNHWDVSPVACGGLKPFSVIFNPEQCWNELVK